MMFALCAALLMAAPLAGATATESKHYLNGVWFGNPQVHPDALGGDPPNGLVTADGNIQHLSTTEPGDDIPASTLTAAEGNLLWVEFYSDEALVAQDLRGEWGFHLVLSPVAASIETVTAVLGVMPWGGTPATVHEDTPILLESECDYTDSPTTILDDVTDANHVIADGPETIADSTETIKRLYEADGQFDNLDVASGERLCLKVRVTLTPTTPGGDYETSDEATQTGTGGALIHTANGQSYISTTSDDGLPVPNVGALVTLTAGIMMVAGVVYKRRF